MCYGDLIQTLHERGIHATESQIRWAIRSGKVSRPMRDSSLRFVFAEQHVRELVDYFSTRNRAEVASV